MLKFLQNTNFLLQKGQGYFWCDWFKLDNFDGYRLAVASINSFKNFTKASRTKFPVKREKIVLNFFIIILLITSILLLLSLINHFITKIKSRKINILKLSYTLFFIFLVFPPNPAFIQLQNPKLLQDCMKQRDIHQIMRFHEERAII